MTRLLRLLLAALMIGGSIVLAAAMIYELTRTGTCGAPAGAVAIRECPEGTGGQVLLLILAIFVIPFAGMGIAPTGRVFLGGVWWCFVWIAMGSAAFVAGYGPAAPPGAEDGALGVGITFVAIGGLSLVGVVVAGFLARNQPSTQEIRARLEASSRPKQPAKPRPAPPSPMETLAGQLETIAQARRSSEDDPIAARLRKLDELHTAGLITGAEHAARRREILDEV